MAYEDVEDLDGPADLADIASQLFLLHLTQYDVWCDPTKGAVSPPLERVFPLLQPRAARARALGPLAAS
jgi:hypothetical protein